jgi:hypothetical protein
MKSVNRFFKIPITRPKGQRAWSRLAHHGVYVPGLIFFLSLACQQRKQAEVDTTVPPDKSGYTPQRGPGEGSVGSGPTSNLGGGGSQEETKLLNGWDGTQDKVAGPWVITNAAITPTPSSPPGGAADSNPTPPAGGGTGSPQGSGAAPKKVTYSLEIKPLLDKYCATCHGVGKSRSATPLDSYPSTSLATQSTTKVANGSMPKPGSPQMTPAEKELFARWAADGHGQ